MRRLGAWTARILVAVTIFCASGEVLARALGIVDRLNGYTRLLYRQGPTPDLPYLLRPGLSTVMNAVPIRVNSLGFRGADFDATPAPGVHRTLILGDSVVFGQEMPEDATLAKALERELASSDGQRHEVINGGVAGWDTTAELQFLERVGLAMQPETVVLGMSLNDYDVPPIYSPFGVLMVKPLDDREPGWIDHSEFLTLLRWIARYARGELMTQIMARAEQSRPRDLPPGAVPAVFHSPQVEGGVREMHLAFYRDPGGPLWGRMRAALAGLARVTAAHRLRLLVVIFPELFQVATRDPDLTPQKRLLAACAEAGLRCLDLQPAFAAAGGDLFNDISHPNARGHAVAAKAIAAALR